MVAHHTTFMGLPKSMRWIIMLTILPEISLPSIWNIHGCLIFKILPIQPDLMNTHIWLIPILYQIQIFMLKHRGLIIGEHH